MYHTDAALLWWKEYRRTQLVEVREVTQRSLWGASQTWLRYVTLTACYFVFCKGALWAAAAAWTYGLVGDTDEAAVWAAQKEKNWNQWLFWILMKLEMPRSRAQRGSVRIDWSRSAAHVSRLHLRRPELQISILEDIYHQNKAKISPAYVMSHLQNVPGVFQAWQTLRG